MRVELWRDGATWDSFVESHAGAAHYHLWKWREPIRNTFGPEPYYLAAMQRDAIRGVLPLFHFRSRLFGNFMVSVPFFSYGGTLEQSPEARDALLEGAVNLAGELGCRHLELRQGTQSHAGWTETSAKVAMEVPLPESVEGLWTGLSSRMRNKIRRAENHGFLADWGGVDLVPDFYSVFSANMRNLGTPVYPRRWFENLIRCAPQSARILLLRDRGRPVAGAFLCDFRDTMEAPWICSLPQGRKDYSSVLLYWTFLKDALDRGCRRFDLGRCTPGGGTHGFKKLWGCQERQLFWYHWLANGAPVPDVGVGSAKFQLAIRIWKHLPLFVANTLGPRIVRSIP